jgi:ERF superfamily
MSTPELILPIERKERLPVPQDEAATLMHIISRAATDPSFDVAKMERLLEMHQAIEARHAKSAFSTAMSVAQAEMGPISTDSTNPQTKSRYASYAKLDRALRPIYTKHGFALSFDEGDSPKDMHIRVLCHVSHVAGYTHTYRKDMPADGKGPKGGDVMTPTHASGAAMSYGMRYLLKGIFNVAVGEDDNDGNEPSIGPGQIAMLEQLIAEVKADIPRLCRMLKVDTLADIRVGAFETVKSIIEAKRVK